MSERTGGAPTSLAGQRPGFSVASGAIIGLLGGLIGLGGAEFRLPVLIGPLGYPARRAVPLNLAVSLITLIAALAIRVATRPFGPVVDELPAVLGLIAGAAPTAVLGVALAGRLSRERFEQVIVGLLVAIGIALVVEGFLSQDALGFVGGGAGWRFAAGAGFGLGIGLVSSLLGVAGGELIIPTLVFAFGLDIATAGTASTLVSLPTVGIGLARYAATGAFRERGDLIGTVAPMGIGSVVGAVAGGLLLGVIPPAALKVGLGVILNVSALRMARHARSAR